MEITTYKSFDDLPAAIAAASAYPQQSNFFLSLDWYRLLYETVLKAGFEPAIFVASADDSIPVALFCAHSKKGRELVSLSNFYTMEFGITAGDSSANTAAGINAIAAGIAATEPRWQALDLRYLIDEYESLELLENALRGHGFHSRRYFQFENWYHNVADTNFDDYYAARSSRLRNTIKRKEKKLNREHEVEIRYFASEADDLDEAIRAFVEIYNQSWKKPEPYPEFIPGLVRLCARLGILRLGVLYINDTAAAAQLWITTEAKTIIYKLAYIDEYSKYSPGSILSRELFRRAIDDDRVAEIDYGVGSDNYKKDWMDGVRRLYGIRAMNRRTAKGLALIFADKVKSVFRSSS